MRTLAVLEHCHHHQRFEQLEASKKRLRVVVIASVCICSCEDGVNRFLQQEMRLPSVLSATTTPTPNRTSLMGRQEQQLAVRQQMLKLWLGHACTRFTSCRSTEMLEQVVQQQEVLQKQPLHGVYLGLVIGEVVDADVSPA